MRVVRRRPLTFAAALAIGAVVVATCGQAPVPTPSGPTDQPIVLEGRDAGFVLSMRIGSGVVDAGAPIDISATLMWEGANASASIWGSGSGPVSFGLEEIDGDIVLGGAMTSDCQQDEFRRLVPVPVPFQKSGGWSAEDPNAAFYRTFFADPVLRLPAGRWRVTANAGGYLLPCEMNAPMVEIRLEAEILVR
jgi:hypothetical protein